MRSLARGRSPSFTYKRRRRLVRWKPLLLAIVAVCVVVGNLLIYRSYRRHQQQVRWKVEPLQDYPDLFAESLWQAASRTPIERGIILPLFDDIALLGISLILELRAFHVDVPIEVPHCGDLKDHFRAKLHAIDTMVRVYDACALAAQAVDVFYPQRKLFCVDVEHCHAKFRSFEIKVLAVVYSQFQEFMLMDADTLFFQNPLSLFELDKYQHTGTLFFHDRISYELSYLAKRYQDNDHVTSLHQFLSTFDVTPYRHLPRITRSKATQTNQRQSVDLPFEPSEFLLTSHSWNARSGHQMDSSLVLWSKRRQPRATAILASFIALNGLETPPSYGDKEYFFLACELAETMYSFSEFAVGAIGWELKRDDGDKSVLCGDALHYFPVSGPHIEPLYINSDNIITWQPHRKPLYRTMAHPAVFYPGSFTERQLPQTCPFDVTVVRLTQSQEQQLDQRQHLYQVAAALKEGETAWSPT